jgi:hypothetical protein
MKKVKSSIIFNLLWSLPTFGLAMFFLSFQLDILPSIGISLVIYGVDFRQSLLEDRIKNLEKELIDKKTIE